MPKQKKMPSRKAFKLAREWLDLDERRKHPDGYFDRAGRWYPSEEETCPCIENGDIRSPSRAHPYSLLKHCRTQRHFANKKGLSKEEIKEMRAALKIIRAARPNLEKVLEWLDNEEIQPLDPMAVLPNWLGGPIGAKFLAVYEVYDEKEDKLKSVLYSPYVAYRVKRGWQNAECYSPKDGKDYELAKGTPAYEAWANDPKGKCGFYAFGDLRDAIWQMIGNDILRNVIALVEAPPEYVAFWHPDPDRGWRFSTMRVAAIVECGDKTVARDMAKEYGVPTLSLKEAQAVLLWSMQAFAPQDDNSE